MDAPPDRFAAHASTAGLVDLLVVGGGINGTGIARDAAGRGLRVLLCEKDDLAQGTSSRSSGLIHGGLRYLEYGEFRLVREALHEREVLLRIAPHLVRPQRFILPHVDGMRPAWMLRLGLVIYDHLGGRRSLPASRAVWLDRVPEGGAVRAGLRRGFAYSDCRTDDARLVVHNAMGARDRGAGIRTRTELVAAHAHAGLWELVLRDARTGAHGAVRARALVNAAGPWIPALAARLPAVRASRGVRLVKGSHIVVPRFWDGDHAYLLQNTDRRVIFVTPYGGRHALIGTTDLAYAGAPEAVAIGPEEVDYLCVAVNRQLRCALQPADVVHAYAGVRCLVDDARADPSAVTRDYLLDLAVARGQPPLLNVLGGKLTTFRRLAEQAMDALRPHLSGTGPAWTARSALPGGDIAGGDLAAALADLAAQAPFLPVEHLCGLFDRHGTGAYHLLEQASNARDLGRHFGGGLYEHEVRFMMEREWAQTAEDVLWRRSKMGLHLDAPAQQALARWMQDAGGR